MINGMCQNQNLIVKPKNNMLPWRKHTNKSCYSTKTDETTVLRKYMLMCSCTYKTGMRLAVDGISPKQYCDKALF